MHITKPKIKLLIELPHKAMIYDDHWWQTFDDKILKQYCKHQQVWNIGEVGHTVSYLYMLHSLGLK